MSGAIVWAVLLTALGLSWLVAATHTLALAMRLGRGVGGMLIATIVGAVITAFGVALLIAAT